MILLDNCLILLYHKISEKSVAFATKEKTLCYLNKIFYLKVLTVTTANA